jgi:U3 small nucleolar RNA-associated protein 15
MLAGGRLLARVSQHHKTITCLHLASDGKRLVTGGLDRHAKIYDVQTYQVVHTLDFPSPVLSIGITVCCFKRYYFFLIRLANDYSVF